MSARIYQTMFRTFFVPMDPEAAHHLVFTGLSVLGRIPGVRTVVREAVAPYMRKTGTLALGRPFPAPFGLAAGFDKDARAVLGLTTLGFGFVEVGTVTAQPQPGNDKPRLWRLLDLDALRNRMGFNNDGAAVVARRLARVRRSRAGRACIIGVNIGKTKVVPPEDAPADYEASAAMLAAYADYLVVNVSSPNTPGLRDLQRVEALRPSLEAARRGANRATDARGKARVPLLVKIAPDLSGEEIDQIADLVLEMGLDGVVAVNTTIDHEFGPGGLSGPPELVRTIDVVKRLRRRLGATPAIIGGGGITTASDAKAVLEAGADLVQGYTGFIYQGPLWARRVNRGLLSGRVAPRRSFARTAGIGEHWDRAE